MSKAFKKDPKVSIPKGGEAVKGKAIFEAQCATCHAIEQVTMKNFNISRFPISEFPEVVIKQAWGKIFTEFSAMRARWPTFKVVF